MVSITLHQNLELAWPYFNLRHALKTIYAMSLKLALQFYPPVPQSVLDEAQAFRVQRAQAVGASYNNPLSRLR